ncbi:MAG: S8 family peptidase [Hyphomicrobiales bacterium]
MVKKQAYSFQMAVARLEPMVHVVAANLSELPGIACPNDEAVTVITLHPEWVAKSYHPQQLLSDYGLRQVGSRPVFNQPDKWAKLGNPEESITTDLYVAGKRDAFNRWARDLREDPSRVNPQIQQLELVSSPRAEDRLRNLVETSPGSFPALIEVVLHASESNQDQYILTGFNDYAESLGIETDLQRRLHAGGLCFVPIRASLDQVRELARFAFLRVARPMPGLRDLFEIERSVPSRSLPGSPLPQEDALDGNLRIAVFDGGLEESSPLRRWATPHEGTGVRSATDDLLAHGHDVTSAALFGHIDPGKPAARPYAVVDHYRVVDEDAGRDPFELYDALRRIDEVLRTRRYEFVNLSIGPSMPVDDDEVHSWTAILDEHLSDGSTLATIAVGNTGQSEPSSGEARIQVPSDCVNGLSVGSADTLHDDWSRAPYSSFGPGRSPGFVKPDVVQFGGHGREKFLVYDKDRVPHLAETAGTSFAAPSALRLAVGVRAHFGNRLSPLALKALLVHTAESRGLDKSDVGWGRIPQDIADIATCVDGMVRVVYQGELSPSQYLRALVPLPDKALVGLVSIDATFCYATQTDPQDPGNYTRSGLDITFRPHSGVTRSDDTTLAKSVSFFRRSDYGGSEGSRSDAHKWETTLNASKGFRATSLQDPVFDVHYNARMSGGVATESNKIRYALIVTVIAGRAPDLYDRVVRTFAGQLEALNPIIEIPIVVQT